MKLDLYQIDAFTNKVFGGNPACVVPLTEWLSDDILLKIANENAVAETAFFVPKGDKFQLRWFTPELEMDLCGHATLATAHCLKTILNYQNKSFVFESLSGDLVVQVAADQYTLDFPSRIPEPISSLPESIENALSIKPIEVLKSRDYVLIYENETQIRNLRIDKNIFDQTHMGTGGVVITAQGDHCDFVSRFFIPQAAVMEDPVTGSSHCSLIPYWAAKLNKKVLKAIQVSERVGELSCEAKGDRVWISGCAVTYSSGNLWL
jgi:PhzF family phenazine biosynthesis protein